MDREVCPMCGEASDEGDFIKLCPQCEHEGCENCPCDCEDLEDDCE